MTPLHFSGSGTHKVSIAREALAVMVQYRQKHWYNAEAGGQLFGHVENDTFLITEATTPRTRDIRSRFGFRPNRCAEQADIEQRAERGLRYLGDWHTHPEKHAQASGTDIETITDIVGKSLHIGDGLIMVIVGTAALPESLWASFHRRHGGWERLSPT